MSVLYGSGEFGYQSIYLGIIYLHSFTTQYSLDAFASIRTFLRCEQQSCTASYYGATKEGGYHGHCFHCQWF